MSFRKVNFSSRHTIQFFLSEFFHLHRLSIGFYLRLKLLFFFLFHSIKSFLS